ncbi:UNVERIFIED_CONTAM: hypothetical protein NY100_33055, partial [Prevotella sp. 15_C9]
DFTILSILVLEYFSQRWNFMCGEKNVLIDPTLPEFRSAASISDLDSFTSEYNVEGILGQVTADYMDKYYASASLRRDG